MKTLKTILSVAVVGAILVGGYLFPTKPQITNITNVGGDAEKFFGGSTYYLAGSGVSSSATSLTLTKLTIPTNDYPIQDSDLSDEFFMTLEPGSTSRQEFISCSTVGSNTGGNVTLSGCTRGLSAISPYTASTTQAFSHSGGSKLIFSNSPNLYDQALFKGNDETITGVYTYTSTAIPIFDANPTITDDKHFATKKYADDLAIAGSPDGTFTVKGIYEQATQTEMASTTGSTGEQKVLTALYATSTPDGTSQAGLFVPVSKNNGKLHQLWLDLTEAFTWTGNQVFSGSTYSFSGTGTFTGLNTFSATSTMATTTTTKLTTEGTAINPFTIGGIAYTFPTAEHASSTVLSTNGSGSLIWKTMQIITKVDGANSVTNMTGANAQATRTATCPTGTKIVGGGGIATASVLASNMLSSYPSSATVWTVVWQATSAGGEATFAANAYALCINQ